MWRLEDIVYRGFVMAFQAGVGAFQGVFTAVRCRFFSQGKGTVQYSQEQHEPRQLVISFAVNTHHQDLPLTKTRLLIF
jgi:hypothetical protein